jgi:hypothetical protein
MDQSCTDGPKFSSTSCTCDRFGEMNLLMLQVRVGKFP